MGIVEPDSLKLGDFVEDSLRRTGDQIRESTHKEYQSAMQDFIRVIGNIDYRQVSLTDAEHYRQRCLNKGHSPATVKKKLTEIKCVFSTAVARDQLDENPLKRIKMPKCLQNEINIYSDSECECLLKAARDLTEKCNDQRRLR